jgi:ParB family chromosome partitioning protein
MSKSTPRLGKGLGALIAPRTPLDRSPSGDEAFAGGTVRHIPVSQISPNQRQPRKRFDPAAIEGLVESIRSSGVLQPVIVRPSANGQFELVVGERRWRAAKAAGLQLVPAIVRSATDAESVELALIENLQREDLNAIDRANAYRQYVETFGVTIEDLARRIGESRANVSNYMRLLSLRGEILQMVEAGELAMGQARAIAGIEDAQRQLAVARLAARRNLSVRQVEALAKSETASRGADQNGADGGARHISDLEQSLSLALGLSVRVLLGRKQNSGRVVIHYRNLEEFDLLAERIGGRKALE